MTQCYTEMTDSFNSVISHYEDEYCKIKGKDEFKIFKNFYENVDKNKVLEWINQIFVCDDVKNDEKAKKLREKGNNFYRDKNNNGALEAYTESICYSSTDGQELALAFANRSAVLYTINDFKNCLQDIQNSLLANYPEVLRYKIYLRQANSYLKLGKREDTIQTIVKIRQCLNDKAHGLAQTKIDSLLKEVVEIEKCIEMPMEKLCLNTTKEDLNDLPDLKDGKNDKFLYASAAISLKYNPYKGRHVVANRKLKTGDILFVEKPFTFVPTMTEKPETIYLNPRCYHCFKLTKSAIPCKYCTTLFCSSDCLNAACSSYHQWECPGSCVNIWTSLGIGYMALRMILLGASCGFNDSAPSNPEEHVKKYGDGEDNYKYITKLVTNVRKLDVITKLHNVVTAMMLTLYLKEKTSFFAHLQTLPLGQESTEDDLDSVVGGILFRHLLQVVANASVIEDMEEAFVSKFDNPTSNLLDDGYYVRAVGIFPSVSMMNHSCDTNITFHFCDDYIVVKARRMINEGEEIYNSYGYDFRKHNTEERKLNLIKQYCFECKCTACLHPTKPEIFRNGLLCQECKGCALEIGQYFKCLDCAHSFSPKNHFVYIMKAEQLYKKYEDSGNIEYLEKCASIREKAFYKFNYNLYSLNLSLQHYYAAQGKFELWWRYAQLSLEMDEIFMGKDCLQYAVNLRKVVYNIMPYIRALSILKANDITKKDLLNLVAKTAKMKTELQKLFRLFYPKNFINFDAMDNLYFDMMAVVTRIMEKNLLKDDENERYEEAYIDYMYSVV